MPMLAEFAGFLQIDPWPPVPDTLFWAALALVAGGVLGEAVQRQLGLPRIVGYSAVGMVLAAWGLGLPGGRLAGSTRLIVDLALGLLLFELGSRVRLRWLRVNPALLATSVAETACGFVAIVAVLRWSGFTLPVALAGAAITVPASAAVIGRVASELRSAGQVTERMIVLAALNTLFAVLMLKLVTGWLHVEQAGDWVRALSQPLWAFCGTVLLAVALARLVALLARRTDLRNENAVLLLLGLIVLAQMAAHMFNLSTVLLPLMAGVLLRNASERPWVWPRHFGTAGGVLVLMLFVIVGSAWSLQALAAGALTALALLAARALAKGVAVLALARWSGITLRQGAALGLTLTPLAGTSLVLLTDLAGTHPAVAAALAPVVLSALAVMEIGGPLAVQWGLRLAHETAPVERGGQR
jgi:Kef-type K+ transport system membrane component KefB